MPGKNIEIHSSLGKLGRYRETNGNVSGGLSDFHTDFTVNYDDGPLSGKSDSYHGEITDTGAVTGWVLNSNPQINWNANPGSVKSSSNTVVPGKTATVKKPSDVYDAPDGNGNRLGPPSYHLAVGRQLALVSPCMNDWCQLVIPDPEVPGGQGWVFAGIDTGRNFLAVG